MILKNKLMEIIKSFKVRYLINLLLGFWIAVWVYFALFNWEIFIVKININLGFAVLNTFPFLAFFIIGLLVILAIRYLLQYSRMLRRMELKEKNNKIEMQSKDIEILKLREMLYKMQSEEFSKTSQTIDEMHSKINSLTDTYIREKDKEKNNSKKDEKDSE